MAWKNIGSHKLISIYIFSFLFSYCAGLNCGYPGSPAFGRPVLVRESYYAGNFVTYSCSHGYTLKGSHQRTCLDNGTWTSTIPICDQSLHGMDQHAYTRAPYDPKVFGVEKAIDGNRETCTYTDPMKPRWIRVDLQRNHLVEAVAVTVPKNLYIVDAAHFLIYVISVKNSTTSGSATYHKCAEFNGKFSTTTVKLSCATGGFYGRYVHIEDQRNNRAHFGICEIDIFVQKESYECGEPDRPSHSYTSNPEAGVVEYRCVYGYQLEGAVRRRCLPDGQWSGTQPLCIEIVCPSLTTVKNGLIQYNGPARGKPVQGTTANVTCDYGYRSAGLALQCLETGLWSEGKLECEPIDCHVPVLRNDLETYVLFNGSTTYGSMALLHCEDRGSQESSSSIRICREDGIWSPPTIDCLPSEPLKTLGLIEEDENIVPNGVIIGMAVVVFILLIILIFILIFRRKQLSRRQSAESLPSKDTSSSLTVSEVKNGLPYENDAFYASITVTDPKHQIPQETKGNSQGEKTHPPMVEKGILSTILFAKRKANGNEKQKSRKESISSDIGPSFYEEIGFRSSDKKSGKQAKKASCKDTSNVQPVYAQVDLSEKRRSRLAKAAPEHSDMFPRNTNDSPETVLGTYYSEEAPNYDSELDLEPVILRELPPIPDEDDRSSGTYASLSRPPEPPTSPPPMFMRDNDVYGTSEMTENQHIMKENDVYSA